MIYARFAVGSSAIALALAALSPAYAQSASTPASTGATASDAQSGDAGSGDIIVTAQRREQRLQDVPVSVTAVTGNDAAKLGLNTVESLPAAVPGLQIQRQTGGASPFLRGVGSTNTGIGTSRAVALYVDDVYINAAGANVFNLNNISGIEVSRGPQGTLFGRNATGGVIQIRTKNPGSDLGVAATVGYANYDTISGSVYADVRATDTLAFNLAASGSDQRKGYGVNVPTNEEIYLGSYWTVRGKALFESGGTAVLISGDYYRADEDFGYSKQALPGTVNTGGGVYLGKYKADLTVADDLKNVQWGVSGKLTQDLGKVSLVAISAYRYSNYLANLDQEGSPARIIQAYIPSVTKSFSQELRLQSAGTGPFTWLIGGFYYYEDAHFDPLRLSGSSQAPFGGLQLQYSKQILNSYSAFGDATYEVTPGTRVTAGLRYTSDRFHETANAFTATGTLIAGSSRDQRSTSGKLTWRFVLDQKLSEDILAYASYSRGFRSGGFVLTSPRDAALKPEVIDAYEIGLKNQFFDHRVTLNLAGYYYDYSNLQVAIVTGGLVSSVNAAKATIYGADAELKVRVSRALDLNSSISWIHSRYDSFPSGQLFVPNPATCTPTPAQRPGPRTGGATQCGVDLAGNPTPQAPKFTASVGFTYRHETSIGEFALASNYYYNDGFYFGSDRGGRESSYNLVNGSVTWTSPDKKFNVRLWASNLLNEYYYTIISHGTLGDQGSPAAPRTYGAMLGVHF